MQTILDSLNQGYDICIFDTIAVNIDGKELKYMPGCSRAEQLSLQEFPELLPELELRVTVRGQLRHTNDMRDS
jgi:hypothetical protein